MAYAAVISLKQTINGFISSYRASLISSTREILEFAYEVTTSLQKVLERLNSSISSERMVALDRQIRDCANELEDVVESYESNQLYSDECASLRQEITSLTGRMKKLEAEYMEESSKQVVPEENDEEDSASVLPSVDSGVEMVGHSSEFAVIRQYLVVELRPDDMCYFSYLGEVGSGRTFIAKTIFEEQKQMFECCVWVTIGTKYEMKDVLVRILDQVDNQAGEYVFLEDEKICGYLHEMLKSRRYMIVLDDVPDVQTLDYLNGAFPKVSNGSLVFYTTSQREVVTQSACDVHIYEPAIDYLKVNSWIFLRGVSFKDDESIPVEMEEAGKRIAENCRGLKIPIAKTMLFLFRSERTVEAWSRIAADKEHPIFTVVDEISEICEIKTEMQSYNWDMEDEREERIATVMTALLSYSTDMDLIKRSMHPERFFHKMQIISLLGMAGIGKSTYAKRLFKDNSIVDHFDYRVWLTLGPKYQAREILFDILAQIYPSIDKMAMKEDEKLSKDLCAQLLDKRCLVVLDDLWSKDPLHHLKLLFSDIKGTTLVTSRLVKVAKFGQCDIDCEMRLLNKEESWFLLHQKVFVEGSCPSELEKVGRKIANRCEGLPLLILTVADQLLKVEMSVKYWENVALQEQHPVFMSALEKISKTLLPSYQSLPQHLKACFMYLGVFRKDYDIPPFKLSNLWIAEGFLEPNPPETVEDHAIECLSELADRSLVMNQRRVYSDSQVKACRLHPIFRHLSNSEAVRNNFFYAMDRYVDCSSEIINCQRRLCFRNIILLGIKDVYDEMESFKDLRSLLCTGSTHQFEVSLCFGSGFIRILEALAIRFYLFPVEVLKSIHLRYLAFTCNEKLPTSICRFWKLQYLIVRHHMSIKSSKSSAHLPVEIWDLKKLKHLQIMGGCLPNPKFGAVLPKLLTLLDVSAQTCTKQVLKKIPNLKRLGIRIELKPDDKGNPFRCLNRISRLHKLESLKCVVVNPQIRSEVIMPPAPVSMFPSSLKRLSLNGFGYPWELMSIIGKLVNLEELKLKGYAFHGPRWEIDYTSDFGKLKFLSIEDTDLVQWDIKAPIFQQLKYLRMKHCYKLRDLPTSLPLNLRNIEIVDCNPITLSWAEQMRQPLMLFEVESHLSWISNSHKEDSQYLSRTMMRLPFAWRNYVIEK